MICSLLSRHLHHVLFLGFITHIPVKGAQSTTYDQHAARRALIITRHLPASTLFPAASSISANNTSNNSNSASSWWPWMNGNSNSNSSQSSQMNVMVRTEERVNIPIVSAYAEPIVIQVPLANQKTHAVEQSIELESLLNHVLTKPNEKITWNQAAQAYVNVGNIQLADGRYGRYFFDETCLMFITHIERIEDSFIRKISADQLNSDEQVFFYKNIHPIPVTSLSLTAMREKGGDQHSYYCQWEKSGDSFAAELVDSVATAERLRQKDPDRMYLLAKDEYAPLQEAAQKALKDFQQRQKEGPTPREAAELKQRQEEGAAAKEKADRIAKGMQAADELHQQSRAFAQQNNAEHEQHLGSRIHVFAKAAPICNDIINGCWSYHESHVNLLKALSIENWVDILNGFRSPVDFFNVSYFWRFHNFRHAAQQVEGKDGSKPFEQWAEAAYVLIQQDPAYSKCWQEIPNNARNFICTKGKELYQKNKMLQSQRALKKIDVAKVRTTLDDLIRQTQSRLDRNQHATFPGSKYQKDHDKELVKALQTMLDSLPSKGYTKEDVGGINEQEAYQQVAMERLATIGAGSHDLLCFGTQEHRDMFDTLLVKDGLGVIVRLLGIKGDAQKAIESVCKEALGHFRQGKDALERGDIQLATQHIEKMHTFLSYGQYIESARSGKSNYGYNDQTIQVIASDCRTKHDAFAQDTVTNTLPRACREQCTQNCENALLHFIQREHKYDTNRYKAAAESVEKLAHDRKVVTKVYPLSPAVQQAIQKNGYQVSMFESCTGHEYDQSLHNQSLQLFENATLLGTSPIAKMLNTFAHDSIQARLQGDPLKAQRLINLGREMCTFVPITDALAIADACQGRVSQEQLSKEGKKIVQQVRDFVDRAERFGIGVVRGVSHGVQGACDIVVHPITSGEKLLTGMGSLARSVLRMSLDQDILMHPEQYPSQMYQDALGRVNARYTMITACADHLVDSIQNMKAEDLGEFIGRFGTDCLTGELSIFGISKLGMATKVLYNAAKESGHFGKVGQELVEQYGNLCNKLEQLEAKCAQALNKAKGLPEVEIAGTGGKAGVEAMETERAVGGAGKQVAKEVTDTVGPLAENYSTVNMPRPIYKTVQETGEQCRIVRPLDISKAELEWAPKKYEEIRNWTDDVARIAKNTGWEETKVKCIKDHLFHKEHILRDRVGKFSPDSEIAAAWDRLYAGDFIKNDVKLLEHEYFESRFEGIFKTDYDTAHNATEKSGRNWNAPELGDI